MKRALVSSLVLALVLGGAIVAKGSPQAAASAVPSGTAGEETSASPAASDSSSETSAADAAARRKARLEALRKIREYRRVKRTLSARRRQPLTMERTPLKDALNLLAEMGNFGIVYDPELEQQGFDLSGHLVSLTTKGLSYEQALLLILPRELGYRVGPGYVLVTTIEKSWLPLRVASYSVMTVLAEVPDFKGPRFDIQALTSAAADTDGGFSELFKDAGAEPEDQGKPSPERIIDLILKHVRHENDRRIARWEDEGGPASIQYLGGRLIVSQTEEGHRAVQRLLARIGG